MQICSDLLFRCTTAICDTTTTTNTREREGCLLQCMLYDVFERSKRARHGFQARSKIECDCWMRPDLLDPVADGIIDEPPSKEECKPRRQEYPCEYEIS